VTVTLVASKLRLLIGGIPRLELMGTIIELRLSRQICLVMNVLPSTITFWVDSLNVICWIQRQRRDYKPFVANRVAKYTNILAQVNGDMYRRKKTLQIAVLEEHRVWS
jgi:hypothetical protein